MRILTVGGDPLVNESLFLWRKRRRRIDVVKS